MQRKSRFILCLSSVLTLATTALVMSTQSVSAWPSSNTRALVFSGFLGGDQGVMAATPNDFATRIDADDNTIVVGRTGGTVQVDPSNTATKAGNDSDWVHYVAKYSPTGTLVWMRQWSVVNSAMNILSMELTSTGEIVVGGYIDEAIDLDPTVTGTVNIDRPADDSAFVLKLNANGEYVWHRLFSASFGGGINDIDVSPSGNIIASGTFTGTIDFNGPGGPSSLSLTSSGFNDGFILSLSSAGIEQWVAHMSGPSEEQFASVDVDAAGNIFGVSQTKGATSLVPGDGGVATSINNGNPNYGVALWSLTATGAHRWSVIVADGSSDNELPLLLLARGNGQTLVNTQQLPTNARKTFVVNSSGSVSSVLEFETFHSVMAELPNKKIVLGGVLVGTQDADPTSGTDTKTSTGSRGAIVTYLSESLAYEKSDVFNFAGNQGIASLATDADNGLTISGYSSDPTTLTFGSATFEPAAGADSMLFIVRYDANGSLAVPLTTAPTSASYTPGNKKATLQWTAMRHATRYVVKSAAGTTVCDTTSTSCDVTGLRNGRFSTFTITSYNSAGVASATATSIKVMGGFLVKTTSWKVRSKPKLSDIVTTPSKGAKTWRVMAGTCRVSGKKIVMPSKKGRCTLTLSVAKKSPYPKMSTTIRITLRK